jgi:hypothetical protein
MRLRWTYVLSLAMGWTIGCGGGGSSEETATIGPEGGSVAADGAELSVPPGALAEPVAITVTRTSDSAPTTFEQGSAIYRFEPAGLTFAVAADVTIQLGSTGDGMQLFWTGAGTDVFEAAGGAIQDGQLVAQVEHFSRGFAGQPAGQAGDSGPDAPDGGSGGACTEGGCAAGSVCCPSGEVCQGGVCVQATDGDQDGVPDASDNCPGVANADQADADHDGIGDLCEPYECSDGLDNDMDGTVDLGDTDCSSSTDLSEYPIYAVQ